MRFFGRLTAHSGGETARLLSASAGTDVTGEVVLAEILPFVDDGALGLFRQQLGQFPLHFESGSGGNELLFFGEERFDLLVDAGLESLVDAFGDEIDAGGSEARVLDRHEVFHEVLATEKLQIAEPTAVTRRFDEGLEETLPEKGREAAETGTRRRFDGGSGGRR